LLKPEKKLSSKVDEAGNALEKVEKENINTINSSNN